MPDLQVTIAQGELKGRLCTTREGFQFNSYNAIPYAKPPIGELRFRDPVPADGWSGVLDATAEGQICPQFDKIFNQEYTGDEDSLFINVYSPASANEGHNLPVMVFIHGGAFSMGSGNTMLYGPDHLLQKNVIVVTFNYRLGALGFLCLHTPEVPGNAGLKDQVMALQWVQDNISKFGGDRDNVTIFGESAGSASVQYMMLSESATGLFHRAIMQSGSCLSHWACQTKPEQSAIELGKKMGLNTEDREEILQFLRKASAKDIATMIDEHFKLTDSYFFGPVIEKQHPGAKTIISTPPLELFMSGKYNKVPIIKGINSQEGALFMSRSIFGEADISTFTKLEDFQFDLETFLPTQIKSLSPEMKSAFINKIKEFYFPADKPFADGFINIMSDTGFVLDVARSVNIMSQHDHPVYYYLFGYNGSLNIFKPLVNYPYTGAAHADELGYLFQPQTEKLLEMLKIPDMPEIKVSASDIVTVQRMVEMWTNFAKVGNPTLKLTDVVTTDWKPMKANEMNCLEIGTELKMITNPFSERINFWTGLFKQQ